MAITNTEVMSSGTVMRILLFSLHGLMALATVLFIPVIFRRALRIMHSGERQDLTWLAILIGIAVSIGIFLAKILEGTRYGYTMAVIMMGIGAFLLLPFWIAKLYEIIILLWNWDTA